MFSAITLIATFVAVSFAIVGGVLLMYGLCFRHRAIVDKRLQGEIETDTEQERLFKAENHWREEPKNALEACTMQMRRIMDQSGVPISWRCALAACPLSALGAGLLGVFAARAFTSDPHTHMWWLIGAIAFIPGGIAPLCYVLMKRKARLRKLSLQLPEAFEMMSRTVRVGQTSSAAMFMIAEEFSSPISEEFTRCCKQQQLGMSQDVALRSLAKRGGVVELQIFVMAILVQSRCGGNLAELLGNLGAIVRNRLKMEMKVRSLTSEGRMQAITLMLLPFVALIALSILSPDYIRVFYERPWLLGGVALTHGLAAIWIRHIVKLDA